MAKHKSSSGSFSTMNGNAFIINNSIFTQKQNGLRQSASQLIFNKSPFDMEGEVCGTESMLYAAQCWHEIADSSDNLQVFLANDIYSLCGNVQNSINQTDQTLGISISSIAPTSAQANLYPLIRAMQEERKAKKAAQVIALANTKSAKMAAYNAIRAHFMAVYHIDDETMAQVDEWIEQYEAGDPAFVAVLKKYQNKSDKEWENLSDEESKEVAALSILFVYAAERYENGGEDAELYKGVCETYIANFYKTVDTAPDGVGTSASLDQSLVYYLKGAMEGTGASDSLAYNILYKVENDENTYITRQPDYPEKGVDVDLYRDESGYVSVNIQDGYYADTPLSTKQFLAIGRDKAEEYMKAQRDNAAAYTNHGLTDDELVGMFQAVANPNDLQVMTNIATSGSEFLVNGKDNAFDIEYWEDVAPGSGNYETNLSDCFSVSLGQMGAIMLQKGKLSDYRNYVKAATECATGSINRKDGHNILLDISSGAGVYADICSLAVQKDEVGGSNDEQLRKSLNAANANFGSFGRLHTMYDGKSNEGVDENGKNHNGESVTYSDVRITDIDYNENTGELSFNTECKEKSGFWLWAHEHDTTKTVSVKIATGNEATSNAIVGMKEDLRKELERKREDILADCVIDCIGVVNPELKDAIYLMDEISDTNNLMKNSANLVKDGVKKAADGKTILGKGANYGASGLATIAGAYAKYMAAEVAYEKDKGKLTDLEKLTIYSRNSGSGTIGMYDYDTIRLVQAWNKNGVSEIVKDSGRTNDEIYESLKEGENYSKAIVNKVGCYLTDNEELFGDKNLNEAYSNIKNNTGYEKEDIDCAIKLLIYGQDYPKPDPSDPTYKEPPYEEINDIPFELQYACLCAISYNEEAGVNIIAGLEDQINEEN